MVLQRTFSSFLGLPSLPFYDVPDNDDSCLSEADEPSAVPDDCGGTPIVSSPGSLGSSPVGSPLDDDDMDEVPCMRYEAEFGSPIPAWFLISVRTLFFSVLVLLPSLRAAVFAEFDAHVSNKTIGHND